MNTDEISDAAHDYVIALIEKPVEDDVLADFLKENWKIDYEFDSEAEDIHNKVSAAVKATLDELGGWL